MMVASYKTVSLTPRGAAGLAWAHPMRDLRVGVEGFTVLNLFQCPLRGRTRCGLQGGEIFYMRGYAVSMPFERAYPMRVGVKIAYRGAGYVLFQCPLRGRTRCGDNTWNSVRRDG